MLGSYTCISSNVIYAITCTRCEELYIGETKRRMADRFTEHLRSIKINFPVLPVAAHFNSSEHSIFSAMVSVVTSCVNDTYRKTEEERLIYNLGTLEPRDMNVGFHSPLQHLNYISSKYIFNTMLFCLVTRHYVCNVSSFLKLRCRSSSSSARKVRLQKSEDKRTTLEAGI